MSTRTFIPHTSLADDVPKFRRMDGTEARCESGQCDPQCACASPDTDLADLCDEGITIDVVYQDCAARRAAVFNLVQSDIKHRYFSTSATTAARQAAKNALQSAG